MDYGYPEPTNCHFCGKEWTKGNNLCTCGAYRVVSGYEGKEYNKQPYNKGEKIARNKR